MGFILHPSSFILQKKNARPVTHYCVHWDERSITPVVPPILDWSPRQTKTLSVNSDRVQGQPHFASTI
jgi:hypothetical protein